jgi:hypothetical protein
LTAAILHAVASQLLLLLLLLLVFPSWATVLLLLPLQLFLVRMMILSVVVWKMGTTASHITRCWPAIHDCHRGAVAVPQPDELAM